MRTRWLKSIQKKIITYDKVKPTGKVSDWFKKCLEADWSNTYLTFFFIIESLCKVITQKHLDWTYF